MAHRLSHIIPIYGPYMSHTTQFGKGGHPFKFPCPRYSTMIFAHSAYTIYVWVQNHSLGTMLLVVLFSNQIKLFPTILLYWEKYQKHLLEKVKAVKDGIIIAGDGRHDSMGYCAKYGAYTIFCCTIPMILLFSLIQVRGSTFSLKSY